MHPNLHPKINELIEEQDRKGGIAVDKLEPGTTILVSTRNSEYVIEVVEGKNIKIAGGKLSDGGARFSKPTEAFFAGSTWAEVC